jgi:hypothetical protein
VHQLVTDLNALVVVAEADDLQDAATSFSRLEEIGRVKSSWRDHHPVLSCTGQAFVGCGALRSHHIEAFVRRHDDDVIANETLRTRISDQIDLSLSKLVHLRFVTRDQGLGGFFGSEVRPRKQLTGIQVDK